MKTSSVEERAVPEPRDVMVASHDRRLRRSPHRYDLLLADFLAINTGFYLAVGIAYGWMGSAHMGLRHLLFALVVNAVWFGLGLSFEAYRWYEKVRMEYQLKRLFQMFLFHAAVLTLVYYHFLDVKPSLLYILSAYALSISLVAAGRIYRRTQESGLAGQFKYVIVGGRPTHFRQLFSAFNYSFQGRAQLVGRFGSQRYKEVDHIGEYSDIIPYLRSQPDIDKLILYYTNLGHVEEKEILDLCVAQYIEIEIAPRQTHIFPRGYKAQRHGEIMLFTAKEEPLARLRNKVVKRAFDIVFSALVLTIIFPPMLLIVAILIKLESKGPIFFKQERSGYRNDAFYIRKFRTMTVNKDSDSVQATKGDTRITKIGAFLRRTSLDEFPQFINVFLGDMSVVGPRPHMVKHTQQYADLIEPYLIRQKIRPGVTGWAQVNGFRGPTEQLWKMEKRVEHDVWYLENWSFLLDIRCIYMTVCNVAGGQEEGAL